MLSFIVIGKNEGWRLERCLSAIKRIAAEKLRIPYEVIYVDSQSTDNSISIAHHYSDKVFLITGECNAAIGRNIGAKEAKGDILFFLDGDMELWPDVLPSILNKDGELVAPFISGIEYEYLYDNNWELKDERPRKAFVANATKEEATTGGLFVIERWLWEEVSGMDNRFRRCQDMDFGYRLYMRGYPLQRMGQLWVNHYTIFYAVRSDEFKYTKYKALLLRKHFFEWNAQKDQFKANYSCYFLLFSLLFIICSPQIIGLTIFIPYMALICYRGFRAKQRTTTAVSFMGIIKKRLLNDIIFLHYFLFFYPKQPQVTYIKK